MSEEEKALFVCECCEQDDFGVPIKCIRCDRRLCKECSIVDCCKSCHVYPLDLLAIRKMDWKVCCLKDYAIELKRKTMRDEYKKTVLRNKLKRDQSPNRKK